MSTHSRDTYGEYESDDGYDSAGSLVDFIVEDEDDGETGSFITQDFSDENESEVVDLTEETRQLVEEFPYDPKLLQEEECLGSGLRRSRRVRKAPERYVDENYTSMMLDDASDLSSGSDEEYNDGDIEEEEDSDFSPDVASECGTTASTEGSELV